MIEIPVFFIALILPYEKCHSTLRPNLLDNLLEGFDGLSAVHKIAMVENDLRLGLDAHRPGIAVLPPETHRSSLRFCSTSRASAASSPAITIVAEIIAAGRETPCVRQIWAAELKLLISARIFRFSTVGAPVRPMDWNRL
jgi:hypothetical protein